MIPIEEIFEAYFECRRNKRYTVNAQLFELDYTENCIKLWEDLNNGTYKIGKSICFVVTRPKPREIFAADFRDRIVHHWIMSKLEPLFEEEFIFDTYNCRKNKGTLFGVHRLSLMVEECSDGFTTDCYIAKFDFKGFFMSIDKLILWNKLEKFIEDRYFGDNKDILMRVSKQVVLHKPEKNCVRKSAEHMWDLLTADKSLFTCGENKGLPIGNLTSQIFANFYLNDLDKMLSERFLYYGRYVDDFFIVCKEKKKILKSINDIKKICSEIGVTLHPKKIYIQHYTKGCSFVGGVVKKDRKYITNRTLGNIDKLLLSMENDYTLDLYHVMASLNSYFGFLKHYKSYVIRRNIFNRIPEYWMQFFNIYGDYEYLELKPEYKLINIMQRKIKEQLNNDLNIWIT